MLAKHRGRCRTLWTASDKPVGGAAPMDGAERAAALKDLRTINERAERIRGGGTLEKRCEKAAKDAAWLAELRGGLPSAREPRAGRDLCAVVRGEWRAAAEPQRRSARHAGTNAKARVKALAEPMPAKARPAQPNAAADDGAGAEDRGGDGGGDDPLREVSQETYVAEVEEWMNAKQAALERGEPFDKEPPCNPEQRDAARPFVAYVLLRRRMQAEGRSIEEIAAEAGRLGLSATMMMIGAGGTGKSMVLHEIEVQCGSGGATLVITAYTGVAAAPFNGPTTLRLLNLGITTKNKTAMPPLDQAAVAAAIDRFLVESGVQIGDVGGIAIDECSFLGVCVIGHIHNVLRCIVRPEAPTDVPFGGVPVSGRDHGRGDRRLQNCTSLALVLTCPLALLAAQVMLLGDCLQKPAPGEEHGPWFSQLVQRACDPAPFAASKRGPGTAAWTGLDMLALMPRVVLSRMMRSRGDEQFCEDMRDIRRTECAQPVSDGLVARLKEVGTAAEGAAQDPGFKFAPVGVLSKLERDTIGHEQKHAFACEFDVPLVQWPKLIVHADLLGLDEEEMMALYEVRSR